MRERLRVHGDQVDGARKRARLDGEFQISEAPEVHPDPRIALDDLRKRVAAVWAAENDAGATVDVSGPDRPGCTTAATGPDRGCHLDREYLLKQSSDRVAVQHQLVHLSVRWGRSVRS
jgi:hypothetical protein